MIVFAGMSVYAYAASLSLTLLQTVHETFLKTSSKESPWNVKGNMGYTALHYAVEFNLLDELQYLLEFADANTKDDSYNTPLILSCIYNRLNIFKVLANTPGIDVNAVNIDRKSALYIAVSMNNLEMTRKLMQKGALLEYSTKHIKHKYYITINIIEKTKKNMNDIMKQFFTKWGKKNRQAKKKAKRTFKKHQMKLEMKYQYESLCKNLQDSSNKHLVEIFASKLEISTNSKSKAEICQDIARKMVLKIAHSVS
jgi:ankyrin repeat protein